MNKLSQDVQRYFDNAATTPLDPRVLSEMLPYFSEVFGNANSIHEPGRRARAAVELARERVAALIGADDPSQITFTSGATEANNWVLRNFPKIAVSPFEHSSVIDTGMALGHTVLRADGLEVESPEDRFDLISLMAVNNEIGARWDARSMADRADHLHSDITQAAGKIPIDIEGIDYASMSAHKFYGPKGVGALYSWHTPPQPMIHGGEQEEGLRTGTLNVSGIVGMGVAAAIALDEMETDMAQAAECRSAVLSRLEGVSDWQVNGGPAVSPYILSVSFAGIEGETLVIELDSAGYSVSSGAACSSRSTEPSHVLTAMELPEDLLRGTVRISFGRFNQVEAALKMGEIMMQLVEKLRKLL